MKNITVKDHFLSQEEFQLKVENETGILYTYPTPTNLDAYYDSPNYISHSDGKKTIFEKIYQQAKEYNLRSKLNLIQKYTNGKTILDYGCGVGDFLVTMKNNGFSVEGFEPNPIALKHAHAKLGAVVSDQTILERKETYDVITLWHVLEHIPNRDEIVQSLIEHLKPKGKLIIAVPNHTSYDAQYYGQFWAAYDVPRHLWHFSPDSMKTYFDGFGMKIENILPQHLDSFYVSILSEKYKGNRLPFFRGVLKGFQSNLKARKTKNYSSLIYVISQKD